MKKIFAFIAVITAFSCAFSQEASKDYLPYSFWSNWSIGGSAMFGQDLKSNTFDFSDYYLWGMDLRLNKALNSHWNIRAIAEAPCFDKDLNRYYLVLEDEENLCRYVEGKLGLSWMPWKVAYIFTDFGALVDGISAFPDWDAMSLKTVGDIGVGAKVDIFNSSTVFAEVGVEYIDFQKGLSNNTSFAKVGYLYNFGMTKKDRDFFAGRTYTDDLYASTIDTDYVDSIERRIDTLERMEDEMEGVIGQLKGHDESMHRMLAAVQRENDSLRNVLASLGGDRTYAVSNSVPFSVLFNRDSYVIKASEYSKIRAVAALMKGDTTVVYDVIGFCDNSGSSDYNMKLSKKRAEAVADMLVKCGVRRNQIRTDGNGEESSFVDGSLAVNRRVSFYVSE